MSEGNSFFLLTYRTDFASCNGSKAFLFLDTYKKKYCLSVQLQLCNLIKAVALLSSAFHLCGHSQSSRGQTTSI